MKKPAAVDANGAVVQVSPTNGETETHRDRVVEERGAH